MAETDRIIEQIIEAEPHYDLLKSVIPNFESSEFKYVHIIYHNTKDDKKILIWCGFSDSLETLKRDKDFKKTLDIFLKKRLGIKYKNNADAITLKEAMFFWSLYWSSESVEVVLNRRFKGNKLVDEILEDSYGYLCWDYQLDRLILLFSDYTLYKMRRLSRGLQAYIPSSSYEPNSDYELCFRDEVETAKKIRLGNTTLFEIISERNLPGAGIMSYDIKRAYNLYNAINEQMKECKIIEKKTKEHSLSEAFCRAQTIKDAPEKEQALYEISLSYAKIGNFKQAHEIVEMIKDVVIKANLMQLIACERSKNKI